MERKAMNEKLDDLEDCITLHLMKIEDLIVDLSTEGDKVDLDAFIELAKTSGVVCILDALENCVKYLAISLDGDYIDIDMYNEKIKDIEQFLDYELKTVVRTNFSVITRHFAREHLEKKKPAVKIDETICSQ